jgi:hypothetical protein
MHKLFLISLEMPCLTRGQIISLHMYRFYAHIIYVTNYDHSGLNDYLTPFPFLDELSVVNRLCLERIQYRSDILIVAVRH